MEIEGQLPFFRQPIDEMYVVVKWDARQGWSVDLRARRDHDTWGDAPLHEHYSHLALNELLNLLPDAIERMRGF